VAKWGAHWMLNNHFESIDPAFAVNEGGGGDADPLGMKTAGFSIAVTEKMPLWLHLTAKGTSGHASLPNPNNPNQILVGGLARLMAMASARPPRLEPLVARDFSESGAQQPFPISFELAHLDWPYMLDVASRGPLAAPGLQASLRDTLSITIISAGNKVNVIPSRAEADVDCRLLPDTDTAAFIREVRATLGPRIEVEARLKPIAAKTVAGVGRNVGRDHEGHPQRFQGNGRGPNDDDGGDRFALSTRARHPGLRLPPVVLKDNDAEGIHGVDERLSLENFNRGLRATYDLATEVCADHGDMLRAAR